MNKMTINLKLKLMVLATVIVTAISLVVVNIISLNNLLKENIKVYKEDTTKAKIVYIQDATKFANIIVESYYNNINAYTNDFLKKKVEALVSVINANYLTLKEEGYSEDEIRKVLKRTIEKARYGKNGYFWVNDTTPKMVMHPIKPSLNGKDLSNIKDPNGVYLFKEMVRVVNKNGGGGLFVIIGQSQALISL